MGAAGIHAAAGRASAGDAVCPPNLTLCNQQGQRLIFSACFPVPLPIAGGGTVKAASPVTPAAGDAGALGSDQNNRECSNLRLQISFVL